MFEQSTLPSASASKRFWATSAGAMAEGVLLVFAIIAPMLWPQVLPRTNLITALLPPVPQGRPKPPADKPNVPHVRRTDVAFRTGALVVPTTIPRGIPTDVDPPLIEDSGPWVDGGNLNGVQGAPPAILDQLMRAGNAPAPAPRTAEPARPAAAPAAVEPKRVRLGGRVKMAEIIRRVEPQYPAIAKQMRVQGDVQLMAIIGIDGHLKEVQLIKGHPLLARAAIEAVSQWIYKPTTLNDEPVEVIAPITITFHLN